MHGCSVLSNPRRKLSLCTTNAGNGMNGGDESFSLLPYAADNAISSGPIDESDDDDPGQVVMLRMENGTRVAMESMRPYMPQIRVAVRQAVHTSNSSCSAAQRA